ncbi:FAD dependent oxidoreductase [Amylocarpus encephaloides]|uniref:FAD dependent oxidoreductase n=1 Tax=Amylocarpus encephaloides TaxID=45428 RepID=A0A9P8C685_9HELO|nr:FAD dependent oxidoreductase [Amylocarpus encephaloides]
MASETYQNPRNIVIVGGGVIGCTTAYFLTRHPAFNPAIHKITLLEAQSIASGASGKAGGLLGLWAYPANIVPLSYRLHAELAQEHDGAKRWGYRALHCGSVYATGKLLRAKPASGETMNAGTQQWKKLPKTKKKGKAARIPTDLDWLDSESMLDYSVMGTPQDTAQVHPYLFTNAIAELATEKGAQIILGAVKGIDYSQSDGVKSVTYEDKATKESHTIPATDVVLAAGPWTNSIFPEAPIKAIRAHSVVIKADVSPYAIFTQIDLPRNFSTLGKAGMEERRHAPGDPVNPEMYARPDGTIYACGEGDELIPLPASSDLVVCDESRCDDIYNYLSSISDTISNSEVTAKQACYLPLVDSDSDRGPIIGKTGVPGIFIATGHTCWGVQNSCATGKLMSEFVFDSKAISADVTGSDPKHVMDIAP